jgi:DNA-binding NtrC family response regulator
MNMSQARTRVLLVDDEPGILRMFRTALADAGFEIEEARDGRGALERLAMQPFDVIVSDVNMPGCGGLELLQSVHERYPDTPMIMMTGKPSLDTSNRALELGAVRYLVKPVFPAALKEAVERAAQESEARRTKQGVVAREWACTACGHRGMGSLLAGGWQRYPLGWFVQDAGRLACSEACTTGKAPPKSSTAG